MNAKFGVLLAVNDINISRRFYEKVLSQKVSLDLGGNVSFESGFSIQADYADVMGEPNLKVTYRGNDHQLVTEVEDFDEFINHLQQFSNIVYVHITKEQPWRQRAVRFYDPDFHIIEVAESMGSIFKRLYSQGMEINKIAEITWHPVEFVRKYI